MHSGGTHRLTADETAALDLRWLRAVVAAAGGPSSCARLAEVDCGDGRRAVRLARACPAATVHGFDVDAAAVQAARRAAARAGVSERVTFEAAPFGVLPGAGYDVVCLRAGPPEVLARQVAAALSQADAIVVVLPAGRG